MGYKAYSDSYLMSLTKPQIIELLRVAEHNFFATEEALNNSAKAGMKIAEKFDKAKELLKLAVEDFKAVNSNTLICRYCKHYDAEIDDCGLSDDDSVCEDICDWRYADKVRKLINDEKITNVK